MVWKTVETSHLSVNPSLNQRFRKTVQRDLQGVNDIFKKAVACGNSVDKRSAFETLQEVPGSVCDYRKGDVPVNLEALPASCRTFVSSADP